MKYEKITNKDIISYPDSYVTINIITTGPNIYEDKIVAISSAKVIDNEIVDIYASFINPNIKLTKELEQLTNIPNIYLKFANYIEDELSSFIKFIDELPIIGFNTKHIINFLNYNLLSNNMDIITNDYIDIINLCKKNIKLKYYTLDEIRKYFKLEDYEIYNIYTSIKEKFANSLRGKTVVITGTLKMSRNDAIKIIRDLGGIPSNTVTKNTQILVKGDINHESNKLKLAKIYDTKVIDEYEFYNIID